MLIPVFSISTVLAKSYFPASRFSKCDGYRLKIGACLPPSIFFLFIFYLLFNDTVLTIPNIYDVTPIR